MKNQKGNAIVVNFALLVFSLFFIFIGIKIAPTYIEHYSIVKGLERLNTNSAVTEAKTGFMAKQKIHDALEKYLMINTIDQASMKDISIKTLPGMSEVHLSYQVKIHMFANIDAIINFNEMVAVNRK